MATHLHMTLTVGGTSQIEKRFTVYAWCAQLSMYCPNFHQEIMAHGIIFIFNSFIASCMSLWDASPNSPRSINSETYNKEQQSEKTNIYHVAKFH